MTIKIFDNFLSDEQHSTIKNTMESVFFPWHLSNVVKDSEYMDEDYRNNIQFVHIFYENYAPSGSFTHLVHPIVSKINPISLVRIKANLNSRTEKIVEHGYHIDWDNHIGWSAVYYVNDNDGYTMFEDGTRCESISNRLVCFDSTMAHTGTTCTDEKYRILINLNFYGGDIL